MDTWPAAVDFRGQNAAHNRMPAVSLNKPTRYPERGFATVNRGSEQGRDGREAGNASREQGRAGREKGLEISDPDVKQEWQRLFR